MSTGFTTLVFPAPVVCHAPAESAQGRTLALRLTQAMVLLPLFSLIVLPEYVQGLGDPESKSILYRATLGPLRLVDGLLLGLIAVHSVVWASSRKLHVSFPRELAAPAVGFVLSIVLAILYGGLHGGENLFFDWRALALGCGLYGVFALWTQNEAQVDWAVALFAGYMAARIAVLLAQFARGGGDVLVGVRIPVFDGPTLSAVVFIAVFALCASNEARSRFATIVWMGLSGASYLLVLLCVRRTFWAELGIATLLLLVLRRRGRGRNLLLAALSVAAVGAVLGPTFYERMQSMDFTQDETQFSQGNPDHVGELVEAWEQVQRHPVMGIGLGRSFETLRIRSWKEDSVMVHNAPLHVWLKYGALGLICYVWFHAGVFRSLWRQNALNKDGPQILQFGQRSRLSSSIRMTPSLGPDTQPSSAFMAAALVWLVAQFVVSLGFAPWPYSSVQSSILISFLLAVGLRGARTCNIHPYPSSLLR